jgi:hypothetical protein
MLNVRYFIYLLNFPRILPALRTFDESWNDLKSVKVAVLEHED